MAVRQNPLHRGSFLRAMFFGQSARFSNDRAIEGSTYPLRGETVDSKFRKQKYLYEKHS